MGESVSAKGEGTLEMERKLVFSNPYAAMDHFKVSTPREAYRAVFQSTKDDIKDFPDLQAQYAAVAGILTDPVTRRSFERKDLRVRAYFVDAAHKISDDWEIRLDETSNICMIKQGASVSDHVHTFDRREVKIEMFRPRIGSLKDIETNSHKNKKIPKALGALFSNENEKLYPPLETFSMRDKLSYFRLIENGKFRIEFELAQDEGRASLLVGKDEGYDIDQIELEVKGVIDLETGIDMLKSNNPAGWTMAKIKSRLIEPALDQEEQRLYSTYGLEPFYESKAREGLIIARQIMASRAGMKQAEQAREHRLSASVWQRLDQLGQRPG